MPKVRWALALEEEAKVLGCESGFGRRPGGKPKNCTKISMANGCRPSTAAAAWTTHKLENGSQVMPEFVFDEVEAVSNCTMLAKTKPTKIEFTAHN